MNLERGREQRRMSAHLCTSAQHLSTHLFLWEGRGYPERAGEGRGIAGLWEQHSPITIYISLRTIRKPLSRSPAYFHAVIYFSVGKSPWCFSKNFNIALGKGGEKLLHCSSKAQEISNKLFFSICFCSWMLLSLQFLLFKLHSVHCSHWALFLLARQVIVQSFGCLPRRIIIVIKQAFLVRKWRRRYRIADFETLSLHWDPSFCNGQALLCSRRNLQWNMLLMGPVCLQKGEQGYFFEY